MLPVYFIKPKKQALYQYALGYITNNEWLKHVDALDKNNDCAILFFNDLEQLVLENNKEQIQLDFSSGKSLHRFLYGGGKNQPLAKACGLNKRQDLQLLDATAGLAQDAFVLATLNNKGNTTLIEQHPAVYSLIQTALLQNIKNKTIADVCKSMKVINANAVTYMEKNSNLYDVIYLDPMYPERKKSAKVKKGMKLLQDIIGHEQDENALLSVAIDAAKKRVVVKRPKGAPYYAGLKPSFDYTSKNTRYDVYLAKSK